MIGSYRLYQIGWHAQMDRARRLAMERGQRMAVRGVLGPSPGWKYVVTPAGREWRGIKLDEVRA